MNVRQNTDPTRIYVLSKVNFQDILDSNKINDDNVDEFIHYAFICINDSSGDYYHNPLFVSCHHNVINLFFDDVENDMEMSPTNHKETRAFTENDAAKVIKFLDENYKTKFLLVHCAGGISRSGAIGQFALDYLKGDKNKFKLDNPQILPNARVLRLLNNKINQL